ncbi:DUF262 domain-containing protein [Pectinatus frisingensis]|uniref:DUF262 domain-containing protein n=1 Tax=Pectinatus frisingensis TaxID=865 RepID=UPI0018C722F8|nr:DUF262 domain-containing protein [Pectinatus frisingensis]
MKYADIKKFIGDCNYRIDVSLRYFKECISGYINSGLQLNPDFQRGNVWTQEQQIKYMEFLIKGGKSSRLLYFNHPGWQKDFKGDFVCVDGLQRITAIQKFLNDELLVFGKYKLHDFEDYIHLLLDIRVTVCINNLKTRREVLEWYIEFNSGGTIHSEQEIKRVKALLEKENDKHMGAMQK